MIKGFWYYHSVRYNEYEDFVQIVECVDPLELNIENWLEIRSFCYGGQDTTKDLGENARKVCEAHNKKMQKVKNQMHRQEGITNNIG